MSSRMNSAGQGSRHLRRIQIGRFGIEDEENIRVGKWSKIRHEPSGSGLYSRLLGDSLC